jgi:hypothetical protein
VCPELFRGIAWSSPSVLSATLDRASALGISVGLLETLPDVDGPEDVRRHWERLRPLLEGNRALLEALDPERSRRAPSDPTSS